MEMAAWLLQPPTPTATRFRFSPRIADAEVAIWALAWVMAQTPLIGLPRGSKKGQDPLHRKGYARRGHIPGYIPDW